MAKIYYIGDWAVMMGPVFAETPFNYAVKGTSLFNYGKWLKDALESAGTHEVTSVPTWDFYQLGPGEYEEILETHDVIVFSDVEAKCFQLAPSFFDRSQFGKEPLTFPDRIRLTVEALRSGKAMMFMGGWLSFNGEMGKGGWGRTGLREVLPVQCLPCEDLCESTEGWHGEARIADHPILDGVPIHEAPPILGYNKVEPKHGTDVIATWEGTDDPMIAVARYGKGRVMAYTSDPAPHWGCNFVYWEHYARLWLNVVDWLTFKADAAKTSVATTGG